MNKEQTYSSIRSIIIGAAGLFGGFFMAKGYFTETQVSAMLNSPLFASLVTMAATAAYGIYDKTQHKLLNAAAEQLPANTQLVMTVASQATGMERAEVKKLEQDTIPKVTAKINV